jgi:hypothetical protein
MKNVMALIIILGFLFIGLGVIQAQPELTWVKDNFNVNAGNWGQWWGAYTTVARVVDLPNTGDRTLQCTFANMGDGLATGIFDPNGVDASNNPDVADTLTMEVYFPLDFDTSKCSRITLVCQPQTAPWSTWYEVDFKGAIVLGAWNHLAMNIDSLKGVSADYTVPLRVGPRFYTTGDFTATYYIDNVILHGVQKPQGVHTSPRITVEHHIYWGISGQRRWADRIKWVDMPDNIAETYSLYASQSGAITDVNKGNAILLAAGLGRGNQVYNHWVYSTDTSPQTWYYAMTTTIIDDEGYPDESAIADSCSGNATGPTSIPYIIPFVSDWSGTFIVPDADLSLDFLPLAATMPDMKIQPEWMFGNSTGTGYSTDAEVPVDTSVFNFEMYMVMDPTYLYIGGICKDDNIAAAKQLWQGESADIFMSFYDADTVTIWPANMTAANGDHRFGILWGAQGAARWPVDGGADGTITGVALETYLDSTTGPAGTAFWEMQIPLANIPCAGGGGFTPHDNMNLSFCLWQNTVDNDARNQVLIAGCADNNTDTSKHQFDRYLAVNPNRWQRPETWGQIRISSVNPPEGLPGSGPIPEKYNLSQNYPNPFNPTTKINFTLAKASNVKLTVYNILGQKVATLVDGYMNQGAQSVTFNASKLTSGVYFYRLEAGSFTANKKMLLVK